MFCVFHIIGSTMFCVIFIWILIISQLFWNSKGICIQIMTCCWERCVGVDNRSWLHTKFVSFCIDFTKDNEACRKKWNSIYNAYKEDKTMNMRSAFKRLEKCRWYQLVDEFMSDRTHVVSHAHASETNADGLKSASASFTRITEYKSGENTSKFLEPKRKDVIFWSGVLLGLRRVTKILWIIWI